jgi:hypothetical protein
MRKQQIALVTLALWLILVAVYMLLLQSFDFEFFFILCLIGALVITQLIEPDYVKPGYLKYMKYLIAVGTLIFCIIVAQKVLAILGLEIVF